MSSDNAFIAYLAQIQRDFYRIGGPILMVIGVVSCILNLMLFTRKNLRKTPCAIYLVAFNASNFFLIFTTILLATLANGYDINPASYNSSFCRFRTYVTFVLEVLGPSYLILASVDRVLLTSPNALTRQRSTPRLAYTSIIFITVLWALLHIHALILTNVLQFRPGFSVCAFRNSLYNMIMSYYSLAIKDIFIPLLMLVFGLWAVKNVRGVTHVSAPSILPTVTTAVSRNTGTHCSKDRQMIRILFVDITVYVGFNLMVAVVVIYQQINQNKVRNQVEIQTVSLLASASVFSNYIPFCIGFYTNCLASKTFRQEIRNIFLCK